MLAEILEPIKTRQSILTPGQLVDLSEVAIQRLSGKVRLIAAEQATVNLETKGCTGFRSANLTIAEGVYLMEQQKFNLLMGDDE